MRNRTRLSAFAVAGMLALAASSQAAIIIVDDFETSEGRFASANNASGTSAGFVVAGTTLDRDPTVGHDSTSSQKIVVDDNPAATAATGFTWRIRNLSGGGTPANNVTIPSDGYVGFWVKTSTPGLQASIIIDDVVGSTTQNERGRYTDIIADGEWHVYQWNLDATVASTEWFNFNAGNGLITSPTVTIDAVYILGKDSSPTGVDLDATVWIDDVGYNTAGEVPEPAALSLAGIGAAGVLARRRRA